MKNNKAIKPSQFLRDERGGVAIISALTLVFAITCIGMGLDYGRALNQQTAMQRAIDAAVLAGGAETDNTLRVTLAQNYFDANYNPADTKVTPTFKYENGQLTGTALAEVPTVLSQIVGVETMKTRATASVKPSTTVTNTSTETVVTTIPGGLPCIFALDPSKPKAFWLISNSELVAPECEVHVKSNNAQAFVYDSAETVVFKNVEILGGMKKIGGSETIANVHAHSSKVADDPFAGKMPTVPLGPCTNANTNKTYTNATLQPGTYCGVTKFNGGGVTTMEPGLYIFQSDSEGGGLEVTSHTIQGHGVTFYFADRNTGLLKYKSKNRNHLHAPTTGTYAGILMFEPAGLPKRSFKIDSADEQSWQGLVYLPSWDLELKSISKWPNRNLTEMPAWPAAGSPRLLAGEVPVAPTMAVSIIVNTLKSDSLSDFHHTPFAWGTPVVHLPGTTIATLVNHTTTTISTTKLTD
jgi:Flp pilus assembly protein TadG